MDQLDINASALNGAGQSGATARSAVDGRVFALMSGGGRVISRSRTDGTVQASLNGGGRVIARGPVGAHLTAIADGARATVLRRAVVSGTAQVSGNARTSVIARSPISGTVRATGTVVARISRRNRTAGEAVMGAVIRARVARRHPALGAMSVLGESIGTIIPRREVRHLLDGEVRFDGAATLRGLIRLALDGRTRFRLDGSGGGIGNQFPFDEPAPPDRRFAAPQRLQPFTVTEMPIVGTATQQPSDIHDYDIDFSPWFPPGDTIVSATVTASPAMPVDPSTAINGLTVKVWVYDGGTSGLTYTLTLLAITSDGRQKEVELQVKIKEE